MDRWSDSGVCPTVDPHKEIYFEWQYHFDPLDGSNRQVTGFSSSCKLDGLYVFSR